VQDVKADEREGLLSLPGGSLGQPKFDVTYILRRLIKISAPIVCIQLVALGYLSSSWHMASFASRALATTVDGQKFASKK